MKAGTVMASSVVSIRPEAPISEAIKLMLANGLSGLPVTDENGSLLGILSEGDFLRRGEIGTASHRSRWIEFFLSDNKLADEYVRTHGRRVSEIMTTDVAWVRPNDDLEYCVGRMLERGVKRLPVLENGKLVGILTRADLLRAVMNKLPADVSVTPKPNDARLRADIFSAIKKLSWINSDTLMIAVKDGAVELSGTIFDERTRQALIVAIENVPGVISVTDNLALIEPFSGTLISPT